MFNAHDPRAQAILSVHHGHISVIGDDDGEPEFHAEDDTLPGWISDLHANGYVTFDAGTLPAQVRVTELGSLALMAVFSIIPPAPAAEPEPKEMEDDEHDQDGDVDADDGGHDGHHGEDPTGWNRKSIEYMGLDPEDIEFVNDEAFRSIIRSNGFHIGYGDEQTLDIAEPLMTADRFWVVDPGTDSGLHVLNDGPCHSRLENPVFIEILRLMDDRAKAMTQTRLFLHLKDYDANPLKEGALDAWVDEEHPMYDREFDFTTGYYRDQAPSGGVTVEYYGLSPAALDFINDSRFLALVDRHGYTLHVDDRGQVAPGEQLSGKEYLSVVDPLTGARMYVLYDDETRSDLESPGFIELLNLMDEYSKAETGTRLFMFEPETDEEEDELNLMVDEDHPCYGLEYDFTTGRYST